MRSLLQRWAGRRLGLGLAWVQQKREAYWLRQSFAHCGHQPFIPQVARHPQSHCNELWPKVVHQGCARHGGKAVDAHCQYNYIE